MVRLPDIPIQSWLQDQADRFHEATAGHFDALEFDDGARQMEASIPPDYDAPGGMDQWQAVEQQRIQADQERQRQEEEQRRQQQAALEEQQRAQQEAQAQQAREQQAMSWADQLGIPSPESLGSELTRWWNRPADHIGTTGVLDQTRELLTPPPPATPEGSSLPAPEYTPERSTPASPADQFLSWAGGLGQVARQALPGGRSGVSPQDQSSASATFEPIAGPTLDQTRRFVTEGLPEAARSLPEALSAGVERFDAARRPSAEVYDLPAPRGAMDVLLQAPARGAEAAKLAGGLPAAYSALTEGLGGVTNTLGRAAIRGSGGSDEAGSSGIDLNIPYYGRLAPSQQDLGGLAAEALLDPTNLVGGGEAHVVRELSPAIARQFSVLAAEHGPEIAFKILGITPAPSLLRDVREVAQAGADAGIPLGRGARQFAGMAPPAAEQAAEQASGVQYLGSGLNPYMGTDPAGSMMRQRVLPPEVVDQLDLPIRLPDDPAIVQAIEAAGGSIDETGTSMHLIRNQGPEAAGGVPTRGMTYHIAGRPGDPNPFAGGGGIGGSQRVEAPTKFRNPLFIEQGDGKGYLDDALEKLGVRKFQDPQALARLQAGVEQSQRMVAEAQQTGNTAAQAIAERELQRRVARLEQARTPGLVDGRHEIDQAINEVRAHTDTSSPERIAQLQDIVRRYGGDPSVIPELVRLRFGETESGYAVIENIIAENARKRGHDAVVYLGEDVGRWRQDISKAIESHPDYKAAQALEEEAKAAWSREMDRHEDVRNQFGINSPEAAQAARDLDLVDNAWSAANRRTERVHDRLVDEIAHQVPMPKKIDEVALPTEAQNPTPGGLDEARIAAARQRAGDAFTAQRVAESEWYERGYDPNITEAERQALRDRVEQARQALGEANDEVGRAMQAPPRQPGYTLRPDIPRKGPVRESTIGPNPQIAARDEELRRLQPLADESYTRYMRETSGTLDQPLYDEWLRQPGHEDLLAIDQRILTLTNDEHLEMSPFITLGSGVAARLQNPALNAAQGAVFGAASETLQAQQEGRDTDYREQLKRAGIGAGLGLVMGSRTGRRMIGRALGSGVTPEGEAGNTAEQFGKLLGGMGKDLGLLIREADLKAAQKRMLDVRRKNNILGPEYDAAVAETPLGKQIAQYQEEIAARRGEVPNPHPLTPEEQALNDAADARARAAPPHSGYLEDPSFGATDDLALADHPDDLSPDLSPEVSPEVSPLHDPDMAPDPFEMVPEAEHLLERTDDLPIASLDEETGAILSHLEAKGGMQAIKNGRSLRNAERQLRAQRREHGLVGPQYDALVAETPLGKQVDQLRTNAAREALPDVPPPPEARPAPPAGSAPKTVDTGPADLPPASEIENWKPFGLHEEVMLKDGSTGKIIGAQRFRGKAADDVLTIRKEDGSLVKARGSQVERHGIAPTASSPHPGFSTGESVPLSRQTSQNSASTPAGSATYARYGQPGGTGRDHPPRLGPADPGPPPVQGPPRPPTGRGSAVREDAEKIRKMYEDVSAGRIKAQEPSDAVVDRVVGTMANVAKNLDKARDRRAVIKYVGNHLANSRKSPLTDEENAHLIALNYEGHEGVSNARIVRNLGPALKGQSRANLDEANIIMTQLDNADKDANKRLSVQQDVLSKVPEARPPKDNVRREGEAVLNETRARASYKAAEREWVKARQERDDLLAEMRRLGEPTEAPTSPKRPGGKPGPVRSMETERSQAMQDRLERANLRHDIADLKRQDEGKLLQAATEKVRARNESTVMERAATKAETVSSERKWSGGATPQDVDKILADLTERVGPERAKSIVDIADAHYKLRDEMREAYVDAGIWSPEQAKELFERFPHYSPIKILEHMKRSDEAFTNGRSFSVRDDLIRGLTDEGTDALRMKPTEAMLHMVHQGDEAIQRNKVMRAVIGWAEDPSMDPFIKPMSASATARDVPDGFKMMVGRVNGTTQNVAVLKELADGLQDWTPAQSGIIMRAVKGAHNYYVASLTGLRPSFIIMNAVNDAVMALARFAVESPNPLEALRGVKDLYNGYRASFGSRPTATRMVTGAFLGAGGETVRESGQEEGYTPASFLKIGAAAGIGALAGRRFKATAGDLAAIERMKAAGGQVNAASRFTAPADVLRELRGERPWVRSVQAPAFKDIQTTADLKTYIHERLLKQGVEDIGGLLFARPLQEIGGVVERGPRIAAFMRAERQGKSQMVAGSAARRVTADPAMGGKTIKQLNNFIPFLNMSTQAAAEGIDMARWNPAKFSAMMGIVAGTVVMNEIWNHHVAPEDAQDITQYTRDNGLAFVAPWGPKGEGKRDILTIPTRGIVGSVVPLVREAMSLIYGEDHRTWDRLASATGLATINQFSPVNADVNGLLRMTTPPLAAAAWEYVSNYDAFRDQPIVSRSMESLPTTMQYDDRTSQLARILARSNLPLVGGSSPMKMEWGLRAISAGPGEAVLGLADTAIRLSGNAQPSDVTRDVPKGARDAPVFGSIAGRFLRTAGSERQNRAYQAADDTYARMEPDVIALLERSPSYQAASPDEQRTMLRSAKQQALETSRELSGVPEFEREKTTTLPQRFRGIETGSPEEKEILAALGTPERQRTSRQRNLAFRYSQSTTDYQRATKERRLESQNLRGGIEDLVTGQSVR